MKILCKCCFTWKIVKKGSLEAKTVHCASCLRHALKEIKARRFLRKKIRKLQAELRHAKFEREIISRSHQTMTELALEATGIKQENSEVAR